MLADQTFFNITSFASTRIDTLRSIIRQADTPEERSATITRKQVLIETLTDIPLEPVGNVDSTGDLQLAFAPAAGDFETFPGGTQDPGELPLDLAGSLTLLGPDDEILLTISGFTGTIDEILALNTRALFNQAFFSGSNTIHMAASDDTLNSLGGDDTLFGAAGNDRLFGAGGQDVINGQDGDDNLSGGNGADGLFGGTGSDRLDGGAQNDLVHGGNGADILRGGDGRDRLIGGFGKDVLTGGAHADTFVYQTLSQFNGDESGTTAATRDVITDFQKDIDKIDVSFILVPEMSFLGTGPLTGLGEVRYRFAGRDTIIEVSTDADAAAELSILLRGRIALADSDFLL